MKSDLLKVGLAIFIAFLCSTNGYSNIKVNSLFSDHMVLQQGAPVTIWGTADDNEHVTISFDGESSSTLAVNGKWQIQLEALPYINTPSNLVISGKDTIVIKDVLVGEVWLCSGQSNMERQLGPRPPQPLITNWEQERDSASFPLIREYYVPLKYSAEKMDDVKSNWTACSPQTVKEFSAVGYLFAKDLYQKLHVPIGIIFSAFGGTPAEDWTSKEALMANPELKDLVDSYDKQTGYKPAGKTMSGLYNGMIYPLIPFTIKGVAWYQGESNNDRPEQYAAILKNMIANWRNDFKQADLPFLIVQIAPHKEMTPEIRDAQLQVYKSVKNTALIVTTDCGDANEIHPSHKQPVGERLALAARALAYGGNMEYSGPVYRSFTVKRNTIILSFYHTTTLKTSDGNALRGFEISGADKVFQPAIAIIKNKKIVVYKEGITEPVSVRYGWANVPDVNLVNESGLPASPFRTDSNY